MGHLILATFYKKPYIISYIILYNILLGLYNNSTAFYNKPTTHPTGGGYLFFLLEVYTNPSTQILFLYQKASQIDLKRRLV